MPMKLKGCGKRSFKLDFIILSLYDNELKKTNYNLQKIKLANH